MTTRRPALCDSCIHRQSETVCAAFAVIPFRILAGADHREPFAGDGGIQYEPDLARAELALPVLDWLDAQRS